MDIIKMTLRFDFQESQGADVDQTQHLKIKEFIVRINELIDSDEKLKKLIKFKENPNTK